MFVVPCSYLPAPAPGPVPKTKYVYPLTGWGGKYVPLFTPPGNQLSILMAALISSVQNSRPKKLFININYDAQTHSNTHTNTHMAALVMRM